MIPFYFIPDLNKGSVKTFTCDGDFIKEEKVNLYKTKDKKLLLGIICSFVSEGVSLKNLNLGKDWRPSLQEILMWVSADKELYRMYETAKETRIRYLEEDMVSSKGEKEVREKVLVLKTLKEIEKQDKLKEEEEEKPRHISIQWGEVEDYVKSKSAKED